MRAKFFGSWRRFESESCLISLADFFMTQNLPSISNGEAVALAVASAVIIIFGSFANALVVVTCIRYRNRMLKEPKDALILSLAIGDFIMVCLVCPFGFSAAILMKWTTGTAGCKWYGFVSSWIGLSSMLQLAALAIERYCTLSRPNLHRVSRKLGLKAIFGAWLLSFIVSCFPLVGWSKYTYEGFGLHCSILWSSKDFNEASYCLFLLVVFFTVPVTAIVFSYAKMFSIVRKITRNASAMWGTDAQATRESYMAQVKIFKLLLVVTGAFLFAWTPYAVMSILKAYSSVQIAVGFHELPAIFAKTSNIYNPIIYFFGYRRLRRNSYELLTQIHKKFSSLL